MKMKLKPFFSLVMCITFLLLSFPVHAESTEKDPSISDQQLNQIFLNAGAPQELINRWGREQKLDLYLKTDSFTFDTTDSKEFKEVDGKLEEVKPVTGIISPQTISNKDLVVSHDIYTSTINGIKYKTVYANYQWIKVRRTFNDKIGIAIPDGWNVRAQSYRCGELQSGIGPGNNPGLKGNCNGGTYSLNFYGAVWELTGKDSVWHNGWVSLDMQRVKNNAQTKVLSNYAADYSSFGNVTFGIQWGPLNLTFTPNSSNSDQVAWDTPFTY